MLDKFHFIQNPSKKGQILKNVSERPRSVCSFFFLSCLYFKYEYNKEESDCGTLVGIFSVLYTEFSSYGRVNVFIFILKKAHN